MDLTATTQAGRSLAESLMMDECEIVRGGVPVFDPETGEVTPSGGTTIYEGPCRVRTPSLVETTTIFGESEVTKTRLVVSVPWDAPRAEVDDVVNITASDDPTLLALPLRVRVAPASSVLMYRALGVEVTE